MKGMVLFFAFVLQLVLARVMGAQWYGEVTYALAWAGLLAVFTVAGSDGAAVRFVAQLDVPATRQAIPHFLAWASRRTIRFLKLVVPVGVAIGLFLHFSNSEFSLLAFLIVLGGIYFQAGSLFATSVLQGLKRPAISQFPLGIALPLLLIIVLSGFHLFGIEARSEYVAISYVLAMIIVCCWVTGFVRKQLRNEPVERSDCIDSPEWDKVAHQLLLMAVTGLLLSKFDILLLGWFVPVEEVGVYNVSARLAELVSLALVVSNLIVAPMIASYYQKREMEQLQQLLTFSGRLVAAVTLLLLIVLIFLGETVLGWYGELFATGYGVLLILSVGQLLNALFGPVGYLLIMTGHSSIALRMYSMAAIIMMLLAMLLTPLYGMTGAAIASAIGVVIWNVIMCTYVVRHLGFDPTVLGMFRRHV